MVHVGGVGGGGVIETCGKAFLSIDFGWAVLFLWSEEFQKKEDYFKVKLKVII